MAKLTWTLILYMKDEMPVSIPGYKSENEAFQAGMYTVGCGRALTVDEIVPKPTIDSIPGLLYPDRRDEILFRQYEERRKEVTQCFVQAGGNEMLLYRLYGRRFFKDQIVCAAFTKFGIVPGPGTEELEP